MSPIDRMLFLMMFTNVLTFLLTQIPFHLYAIIRVYLDTFDPYTHTLIYVFSFAVILKEILSVLLLNKYAKDFENENNMKHRFY